ncbi:hypothetical protein CCAX7_45900 [Capsulimonas corticalis]|uniref:Uncharacterized protein n=1 Tax=Capsulimonas corticalis TaxID=2219043 RepID=A0A402D575_9BACT|nr:glycosyl hydrolase [Capsulimonas corticalis]BDI32539.1 hypothetical protein CCAX7_45900 [Capsulimonas corticalis]
MKVVRFSPLAKLAAFVGAGLFAMGAGRAALAETPFIQSAYLWTQGTDTDLSGSGDWGMYRQWLGVKRLGAESDPGGWDTWANATEGWNNNHWGDQQTRYGVKTLPEVLLSIASTPYSPHGYDTAWEGEQWRLEAENDPATMQHFVNLANNIVAWNYKSVIIRMDYEFDGGWIPYGNLNAIPGMPGNFNKAWRNIVTTVRDTVKAKNPNIKVKFLWNPTDANVQIETAKFYPGDAYVDYIGFDNYDYDYSGVYKSGVQPDAATQQLAWTKSILPRIQWFADFASAANPKNRNGYLAGRSVPLIVGEWGMWQISATGRPAGGDDPAYIQNMYDWMSSHNVYMECYFETPSDGVSTLWPGGYPKPGSGNHSWGAKGTAYPKAAAKYRELFSDDGGAAAAALAASRPPGAPTGLAAAPASRRVTLSWDSAPGATLYKVFRGTSAGPKSTVAVASTKSPSFTDSGLTNGVHYFYKVRAFNAKGAGGYSAPIGVTPNLPENYLANAGFETGSLNDWTVDVGGGGANDCFAQHCGAKDAHSGEWELTHWSGASYEITTRQRVAVPNGKHSVSAWIKSSGGQAACAMRVSGYHGADAAKIDIPASGGWRKIATTVNVTSGVLEVSFHDSAAANQWLNVDDVVVK